MPKGDPAFEAILGKLNRLKEDGRRKAERAGLEAAGELLLGAIRRRAPSQAGEYSHGVLKPGELAASYRAKVKIVTDNQVLDGKASRVNVAPAGNVAGIAAAVEYGHENKRGKKGSKNQTTHGFTPAHPFVRPAWDESEEAATEAFEAAAEAVIVAEME